MNCEANGLTERHTLSESRTLKELRADTLTGKNTDVRVTDTEEPREQTA